MGDCFKLPRLVWLFPALALAFGCSSAQFFENTGYLPFISIARIPIVAAKINGKNAWFIVDSGASVSLLNESAADFFGFKYNAYLEEHVHSLSGDSKLKRATNCVVDLGPLQVSHHMFHTKEMASIVAAIELHESITISGIIGADILNQFRITIDFGNNVLLFPAPKSRHVSVYASQTSWSQRTRALD
jgi:hypothetical protein